MLTPIAFRSSANFLRRSTSKLVHHRGSAHPSCLLPSQISTHSASHLANTVSQMSDNELSLSGEEATHSIRQLFSSAMPKDEIGAQRYIQVQIHCWVVLQMQFKEQMST